ncbi:eukaryotic translation initiation factor EIF4E family protein [archaeon]|nr:MAG: eukaryotic translation initiation factor EIF4E family protein [archaeon]
MSVNHNCPRIEKAAGEHELQTPWAFWYDQKQRRQATTADPREYHSHLHKLCAFDTVEGLWKVYCHLKRPSNLDLNVNLYLFRDGPEHVPMWVSIVCM